MADGTSRRITLTEKVYRASREDGSPVVVVSHNGRVATLLDDDGTNITALIHDAYGQPLTVETTWEHADSRILPGAEDDNGETV